jgi:hypothetical protein
LSGAEYTGEERRRSREPIHPWRWRALTAWIVIFSIVVIVELNRISEQSATVAQLQHTNCGLEKFLLTARKSRYNSYLKSHEKTDIQAVIGYEQILLPFAYNKSSVGKCPVPSKYLIADRPIDDLR